MGNVVETAFFIKEIGDVNAENNFDGKRIDAVYLRTDQNIAVTSIGLCSASDKAARAFLFISDRDNSKVLLHQTIDLIIDCCRHTSYYELSKPVELKKERNYCLSVEVFGGPTFTFLEAQSFSTHRGLTLEMSKEMPIKFNFNTEPSTASFSDISNQVMTPTRKSKTDQLRTFKGTDRKKETTPTVRKSVKGKTVILSEISVGKEASKSPSTRNNESPTPTSGSIKQARWLLKRDKSERVNQISGILFKRVSNFSLGCC